MTTSPERRFAIVSRRVVLPGGIRPAAVIVDREQIAEIVETANIPANIPTDDLGEKILAPGLIDAHVHINEPGRTEWEGFDSATRAAAAGGVTTIVDMPLNSSPVTTTRSALEAKRSAAAGKCWVNVGFYGGVVPGNAKYLAPLLDAGVLGLKAFLCHSGLDEFPASTLPDLQTAAQILREFNRPLLVHAELTNAPAPKPDHAGRYADYLATRPPQWETDAIALLIEVSKKTCCRIHIVHLANGDALPMLAAARRGGLPITVETCPHYLHLGAEEIPDAATQYKCAPPVRESRHRELLWEGLKQGTIDLVGSDHSPCPPEMKHQHTGNFMAAWGGIASLQLTLPIVWTGASRRDIGLERVFNWLTQQPARLIGLDHRKGSIAPGFDADLIVFDPDDRWTIRGADLYHRHKLTPYDGAVLRGRVQRTYIRGQLIYREGQFLGEPQGKLLTAAADK